MLLIGNEMLAILIILITAKAFRGYDTIEDPLAPEPSGGKTVHLQRRESIPDQPLSSACPRGGIMGDLGQH